MISMPEAVRVISNSVGVPGSTVETITRRLGEAGAISRGTRGRKAADASSDDLARILIGVMSIADGIYGTSARVVQAVEQVGNLSCPGAHEVSIVDNAEGLGSARDGTFLNELTTLIEWCADSDDALVVLRVVRAVGLTFKGETTHGWTELTAEAELDLDKVADAYVRSPGGGLRLIFGSDVEGMMPGMTREVRVSIDSLIELAKIAFPNSATSKTAGDNQDKANEKGNRQAAGRQEGENE